MKIDLHVHTKKIKIGESKKRNIEPEKFKEIIKEADIGVVAITNHNYFEFEYFKKFVDKEYILLPGVEIDVKFDENKRKHINVIFPPEKAKKLESIFNEINSENNQNLNLSINELVKYFDFDDTIFYIDNKNSKTSFSEKDYKNLNDEIKKGLIICDTNSKDLHQILIAHDFMSLIGSDVQNWDKYIENDVPRLLYTPFTIKEYKTFLLILKRDKDMLKRIFSKIEKVKVKLELNKNFKDIELFQGINIIFGDKASGKSYQLDKIEKELKNNGKTKTILYESKEFQKNYESLLEVRLEKITENKKIIEINKIIEKIYNFQESSFEKFKNFQIAFEEEIKNKYKLQNTIYKNVEEPENLNYIFIANTFKNLINDLNKLQNNKKKYIDLLKPDQFLSILWTDYILKIKKYKFFSLKEQIKKNIVKILKVNKNFTSIPTDIKLYKKFMKRRDLFLLLEELKKKKINDEIEIDKFFIENKKIILYENIFSVSFGEKLNKDIFAQKININDYNKNFNILFEKINISLNTKTRKIILQKFKKYYSNIEDVNKKFYFIERYFKVNEKKYGPSDGERSFIALMKNLKKEDIDFFLLDEPSVHFSANTVTKQFLPELLKLKQQKKTIVIVTHKSTVGINSIPINYIYTESTNDDNIRKVYTGHVFDNKITDIFDEKNTKVLKEIILNNFEGSREELDYRNKIYGVNKLNGNKS